MDFSALVPDHLRGLSRYVPGQSSEEIKKRFALDDVVKLASNESPYPPSEFVQHAMARAAAMANRYPDYSEVISSIALESGISREGVFLGNGSFDVLEVIFRTLARANASAVMSSHAYFGYPIIATKAGLRIKTAASGKCFGHDVRELISACDANTALLVLDSPGNFSGAALDEAAVRLILQSVPRSTIVVLDQAYVGFANEDDAAWANGLLGDHENLVVTRTFSKVHCLASLRVGYALSHPDLAEWFWRMQQAFPVSGVAAAGALAAMKDDAYRATVRDAVIHERQELTRGLATLGLTALPSKANFVLVRIGSEAPKLQEALLTKGFICRSMNMYREPEYLRITVGTPSENMRFLRSLGELISGRETGGRGTDGSEMEAKR